MKPSALAVICLLVAPLTLARQNSADPPASKEDVERYFAAMHTRELVRSMLEAMRKQMHQTIHAQVSKLANLPPDFEEREDRLIDETWQDLPLDEMLQAMIPVYEKHFTKGDIDGLVAFYTSPTGQKLLKELPGVTAESMQASQGIVQRLVAKEMQRVQNDIAQVQKSNGGSTGKPN